MGSLTDFLSNLPGSSGSFFSRSMFYTEPDGSPRGGDRPSPDTEHLYGVGFARVTHLFSSHCASQGTSCWCPDPPPWFPASSCSNLLANFMQTSLSSESLALAFKSPFVLLFFEEVFIEHLPCARPCTSHWGLNAEPKRHGSALMEFTVQQGRQAKAKQE